MGEVGAAFALTLVAGLATAVGGAVVGWRRNLSPAFLAAMLGVSAGVMLYVSFVELFPLALRGLTALHGRVGEWWTAAGFFGGVVLVAAIDRLVPEAINPHETSDSGDVSDQHRGRMLRTGLMTAAALALHNFPEGFGVFLAATQQPAVAVPVVAAIALHNIPEGIAVAVPVTYATGSRLKGFVYSLLAGLAEPLGALIGFVMVQSFLGPEVMPLAFAAVAGIMVFVSLDELLPAAHTFGHHHATVYGLIAGMAVMALGLATV